MPFTTPLRDVPIPPDDQAAYVKDDKPTPALFDYLKKLQAWIATAQSAFAQTGTTVTTVAGLPAASGCQGARYLVSDANATTFNSIVATGGANIVPVFSNGTTWRIG